MKYDETALARELQQLAQSSRAAFACACAQRIVEAAKRYWVASEARTAAGLQISKILGELWDNIEGQETALPRVEELLESCMALLPIFDSGASALPHSTEEDAVAATAYALRCRMSGEVQDAVWAATRAYETLREIIIRRGDIDVNRAFAEERIISDKLVQAELARQRKDLEELSRTSGAPSSARIRVIRRRAQQTPVDSLGT